MNYQFFHYIYSFVHRWPELDTIAIFLADHVQYVLVGILLGQLFRKNVDPLKNRVMVVLAFLAALIARLGVKTAIVFFYPHPRPYVVLSEVQALIPVDVSDAYQSFPSGHAIFFFALSTVIYRYNKSLGAFFFIFSVLMGIARIFVGMHWPADILGGALMGAVVGFLVDWAYRKYQNVIHSHLNRIF